MKLRDYQIEAVEKLRAGMRSGYNWMILSAPTGAGKTEIGIEIIRGVIDKGKTAEFIVDRRSLAGQTQRRFWDAGIRSGLLSGGQTRGVFEPIRVSMVQTLQSRGMARPGGANGAQPFADLYIIDECHEIRPRVLEALKKAGARVIGLTATPFPERLGKYYENMINVRTTKQLIREEFLCPFTVVAPIAEVSVEGLKSSTAGEFAKGEISKRILQIVGDIVPEWERQVEERFAGVPQPTIVFAASVDDTMKLCEKFVSAGHAFGAVTSEMSDEENDAVIDRYRSGDLIGIVNCAMLGRGFDVPSTQILVDAYPMRKSLLTIIQRYGRVMRPSEGKTRGLLIDHAANWLGFYDDIQRFYSHGPPALGGNDMADVKRKKRNTKFTVCNRCQTTFLPGETVCSHCGAPRPVRQKGEFVPKYKHVKGRLEAVDELTGETVRHNVNLWREVCTVAREIHFRDTVKARRRARSAYKSITGKWKTAVFWPYDRPADPIVKDMIDREFKSWIIKKRYQARAYLSETT